MSEPQSAPKRRRCDSGAAAGSRGKAGCAILLYTDRRWPWTIAAQMWIFSQRQGPLCICLRAAVGRSQKAAQVSTQPSLLPRTSQPAATSASASASDSGGSSSSASESAGGSVFSAASETSSGGTSELSEVADSQEEPCSAQKPAKKVRHLAVGLARGLCRHL